MGQEVSDSQLMGGVLSALADNENQKSGIQDELKEITKQMDEKTIATNIKDLTAKVNALNTKMDTLNTQLTAINTSIANIKSGSGGGTRIAKCVGSSYSGGPGFVRIIALSDRNGSATITIDGQTIILHTTYAADWPFANSAQIHGGNAVVFAYV